MCRLSNKQKKDSKEGREFFTFALSLSQMRQQEQEVHASVVLSSLHASASVPFCQTVEQMSAETDRGNKFYFLKSLLIEFYAQVTGALPSALLCQHLQPCSYAFFSD